MGVTQPALLVSIQNSRVRARGKTNGWGPWAWRQSDNFSRRHGPLSCSHLHGDNDLAACTRRESNFIFSQQFVRIHIRYTVTLWFLRYIYGAIIQYASESFWKKWKLNIECYVKKFNKTLPWWYIHTQDNPKRTYRACISQILVWNPLTFL